MRPTLPLLILTLAGGTPALQAQVDYNARVGVTWATALVRDAVINQIEVRQKLAPTLVLGAAFPIAPLYRAGLELALATSGYQSKEAGATTVDLGTVRTGSITLGLDGPIFPGLGWRAGVGLLRYWPTDEQGIFLRGGTTRFLAGAGIDYRHPVLPQWDLMAALRYDVHKFTTDELQARGFSQSGIDQWEAAFLYGEVRAVMVSDSSVADVIVTSGLAPKGGFSIAQLESLMAPECQGATDVELAASGLEILPPFRVYVDPRFAPSSPGVDECMALTTTHELGHSLGIFAHSTDPADIMHADPVVPSLSPRDRATAELAYHTEPTLTIAPR